MGLDERKALTKGLRATIGGAVSSSGLERELLELVRMRVARRNDCVCCANTKYEHARGKDEQLPHRLAGQRATSSRTARERAALAWLEALTTPVQTHALDDAYAQLAAEFAQDEIAALTLAVVALDGWSRSQQYAASRDAAAAGGQLAGVPFN